MFFRINVEGGVGAHCMCMRARPARADMTVTEFDTASTFLNELRESHEVILPFSKEDGRMYTCRPCTTDIYIYICDPL